jgi:hypothetical protein
MRLFVILLAATLAGCASPNTSLSETEKSEVSTSTSSIGSAFSIPEIGVFSDLPKPEFIKVIVPSKYAYIGDFHGGIRIDYVAQRHENLEDLSEYCKTREEMKVAPYFSDFLGGCRLHKGKSEYVTYLYSEHRISLDGSGTYLGIQREALFLTPSLPSPVILFSYEITPATNVNWQKQDEVLNEIQRQSGAVENSSMDKEFMRFINSIEVNKDAKTEPEWLTYSDEEFGFSFEYPNGMRVSKENMSAMYGSTGATIFGVFAVKWYKDTNPSQVIRQRNKEYGTRSEIMNTIINGYPAQKVTLFKNMEQLKYRNNNLKFPYRVMEEQKLTHFYVIQNDNDTYEFRTDDTWSNERLRNGENAAEAIMSTFRILE